MVVENENIIHSYRGVPLSAVLFGLQNVASAVLVLLTDFSYSSECILCMIYFDIGSNHLDGYFKSHMTFCSVEKRKRMLIKIERFSIKQRSFCMPQAEGEDGQSEESLPPQASRAKLTLLKKKLEEKDRIIQEKEETIKAREQQIEAKERVLAERDIFVSNLTEQLEEKTKAIEGLHAGRSMAGGDGDVDQVVYSSYGSKQQYDDRSNVLIM